MAGKKALCLFRRLWCRVEVTSSLGLSWDIGRGDLGVGAADEHT